jgi:glutathione synthase/RimK-type ligase-like ATP-grasp enzyme
MAKGHWQIYNWSANNKNDQDGDADCLPIEDVPEEVIDMALKSAKLMGLGLYGIDIKVVNDKLMVIEINDNPNIDFGVEDAYYGDLVYSEILTALKKRLD